MKFFKSFVAASMFLFAAGYATVGEATFKKGEETVVVQKSSTGFWVVKEV